jgi:hypothetical protein
MVGAGLPPSRLLTERGTRANWIKVSNGDQVALASAVSDDVLTPDEAVRAVTLARPAAANDA